MKKSLSTSIDTMARTCIAVRLRLLNRVVTNIYDNALRPLGLKVSQGNILIVTSKLGVASPIQVCDILQLDISTLSRNVELMRKKGWLEIVPGDDARSRPFQLTAAGEQMIEKAIPAWEQAQEETRQLLGDDFVSRLSQVARTVSDSKLK